MATGRAMPDVAVLAKAPIPGYAKTRLAPLLGADGAARLQEKLIERALATAVEAGIGPVTLWCAPDTAHPVFERAAQRAGVNLASQPAGDLGTRMLAALGAVSPSRPTVLIGTDCPVLTVADLRAAAAALVPADVVIAPAEDGGYGLIATRQPLPLLFEKMPWGTEDVAVLTRERALRSGLHLVELATVWDVDRPADVARLRAADLVVWDDIDEIADAARQRSLRETRR
jgi:rSAM/selenodomain-associated transferase 1